MRSLVVYESLYGNTREVALAIAEALSAFGEVVTCEVSEAPRSAAGFELLVVGGPIHAWGMTSPMTRQGARDEAKSKGVELVSTGAGVREWLDALSPAESGQAAAAFDTAVRVPFFLPQGSAARPEARHLERLGFLVVAPPEHFFVQGKEGPLAPGEVERARAWARGCAEGQKHALAGSV
jgi:hypothetical protein